MKWFIWRANYCVEEELSYCVAYILPSVFPQQEWLTAQEWNDESRMYIPRLPSIHRHMLPNLGRLWVRTVALKLGLVDPQGIQGGIFRGPQTSKWIGSIKKLLASSGSVYCFIFIEVSPGIVRLRSGGGGSIVEKIKIKKHRVRGRSQVAAIYICKNCKLYCWDRAYPVWHMNSFWSIANQGLVIIDFHNHLSFAWTHTRYLEKKKKVSRKSL